MNPNYPDVDYPDVIESAKSGRKLTRGLRLVTIDIDGESLTYAQPGWWASFDDPDDNEGQLVDEDNTYRAQVIENWRKYRREHPVATVVPKVPD